MPINAERALRATGFPAKPDKMGKHTSVADVKLALKRNGGLLARSASDLGIARQSLSERIARSAELQAYRRELEDEILDAAEGVIRDAIVVRKDLRVARWFLERRGKRRGYGTNVEADYRIPDEQLDALVASLGGDVATLRAALAVLGASPR